jgi:tripartite-type tricarboxylate transporter receptor subunit TctC
VGVTKAGLGAGLLMAATLTHAQNFPVKPVRVITPFTAGSAIDTLARVVGQKLSDTWGQQVVIDNRIGANGIIGTEAAAKAPPDGYTVYLGNISTLAVNPHLYLKLPYDALRDFAPVTLAATIPVVLVVHPSLPVKSVRELIPLAKAHPGQLNYASGGTGSAQHLPMEMLRVETGINIVHVPYKGLGPAFSDVLGGQVPMMFTGVSNVVPYMKTGRLRVLAIGSPKRSATLPEVPTVAEAGVPGFDFDSWTGYLVPVGTPRELIVKLHADITRTLAAPEVRDKLVTLGFDLVGGTPEAFATLIRNDIARFGKLIKAAGIKAE